MARVSKRFVDETLWPEFQEISETLRSYLSGVTDRVVRQVIHQDCSEAEVIEKPKQLPPSSVDEPSLVTGSTKPPMTPDAGHSSNTAGPPGSVGSKGKNKNKRKKRKKRKRR